MVANNKKHNYDYKLNKKYGSYKIVDIFKHPVNSYRIIRYECINCGKAAERISTQFHLLNKQCTCKNLNQSFNEEEVLREFKVNNFKILDIYGYTEKEDAKKLVYKYYYIKYQHNICKHIKFKLIRHRGKKSRQHSMYVNQFTCNCNKEKVKNEIKYMKKQTHGMSKDRFYKWFYLLKKHIKLNEEWSVFENIYRDLYIEYLVLAQYDSPILLLPLDFNKSVSKDDYLLTIRDTKFILGE